MFTHLHLHTEYSLLDGIIKIDKLMPKLKELGMHAVAITDHGNTYGIWKFYKTAKEYGIKPIIGCEVYTSPMDATIKNNSNRERNHLILLCKNMTGYKNLCKIVSYGYIEGMYTKPRVDNSILQKYHEGLICLSACIQGIIPQRLLQGKDEEAKQQALILQHIFGKEDFYIEVQNHGLRDQIIVLPKLVHLAKEIGAKIVATNDCHYLEKEDYDVHEIALCLQTQSKLSDTKRLSFRVNEFYVKSEAEMRELFKKYPEACDTTEEIAAKCNIEFEFGKIKLPYYQIPEGYKSHLDFFKHLCNQGMIERYGENCPKENWDRLEYEISIISKMGYVDYYLIVWDFINYARKQNFFVGPGRGSGAGSIAAYAIKITSMDPMKYGLLFERFLNPERVSMPDFDVDFESTQRKKIVEYVTHKYGERNVSNIVTFQSEGARGAFDDICIVFDVPANKYQKISKLIPSTSSLSDALKTVPDLQDIYQRRNPDYSQWDFKKIFDYAQKLEGLPRNTSKHACGILIADKPIDEYVALATTVDKDAPKVDGKYARSIVVQCTMTELDELGLLKMDFLGLKNLTAIHSTEREIQKKNPNFCIDDIQDGDKATYQMLGEGKSSAVFQFESAGMKNILRQLQPTSIEDLTAVISLYRPGPMDSIPKYIQNSKYPSSITYGDKRLEPILKDTYGCIVYQEQIMKIFQQLAGYSLGRADIVRRAMGKKKHDVMAKEHQIFLHGLRDENGKVVVEGAIARGVNEEFANKLMNHMEGFASYAFNKSHAACYARNAYVTAYLLCHYPVEFMTSMINAFIDDSNNKFISYCNSAQQIQHIQFLSPDINKSQIQFSIEKDKIRYGFQGIKGLGESVATAIVSERKEHGQYTSFTDFLNRTKELRVNKKTIEILIECGAFDTFQYNRNELLHGYLDVLKKVNRKMPPKEQMCFFNKQEQIADIEYVIPHMRELPKLEKLEKEYHVLQMFISETPLSFYKFVLQEMGLNTHTIYDFYQEYSSSPVLSKHNTFLGFLSDTKEKISKNGNRYIQAIFRDQCSSIKIMWFPRKEDEHDTAEPIQNNLFHDGKTLLLYGSVKKDESQYTMFVNDYAPLPDDSVPLQKIQEFVKEPYIQKMLSCIKRKNSKTRIKQKPTSVFQTNNKASLEKEKNSRFLMNTPGIYLILLNENKQVLQNIEKLLRQIPGPDKVMIFCPRSHKQMVLSFTVDMAKPFVWPQIQKFCNIKFKFN